MPVGQIHYILPALSRSFLTGQYVPPHKVPSPQLILKEASLTTVFRYRNKYPVAIEAIASGAIKIKDIVTHTFDFEDTKKAFDFVIENPSDVVKAVIKFS